MPRGRHSRQDQRPADAQSATGSRLGERAYRFSMDRMQGKEERGKKHKITTLLTLLHSQALLETKTKEQGCHEVKDDIDLVHQFRPTLTQPKGQP